MRYIVASLLLITLTAVFCRSDRGSVDERPRCVETRLTAIDLEKGPRLDRLSRAALTGSVLERMGHYKVPGVSLAVIEDFAIAWARSYGVREAGGSDSTETMTLFEAASTTKAVVALAVLQLVARGVIGLDDPVNDRLTSWQIPESEFTATEKVTVRRLLTHTAGLNRPDGGFSVEAGGSPTTVQVLKGERPALNAPLRVDTVPGTRHQYSNFGYVVLQQILEDVSQRPFRQHMQESVFGPLGMVSSTFDPSPTGNGGGLASPHTAEGEPRKADPHPSALAQGGLWTTPSDLGRLSLALMESYHGRRTPFLSAEIVKQAFTAQVSLDPSELFGFTGQGLGLFLLGTDRGPGFSHPGFNEPGATCLLIGFPATGQGAVIMTNGANGLLLSLEIVGSIAREYSWPIIRS